MKIIGNKIQMLEKNYIVINREAKVFANVSFADDLITFSDAENRIIENISINESLYAALYFDEACNVTFVIDRMNEQTVITVLWSVRNAYDEFKKTLANKYHIELSKQNNKINRYAESIAEKLANGVKLKIVDAVDNNDMVECPECGMMNTKNSPYCMECGADL